jgi:hypothetical protein
VTAQAIRVSMPLVELLLIMGGSFVLGCGVGWWVRGR